nr:MAG TPA: hypothetical protein [Caudoviricetes sp.]
MISSILFSSCYDKNISLKLYHNIMYNQYQIY